MTTQDYFNVVMTDTPIALWRLSEASEAVCVDYAGTSHGTYVNSPTLAVKGAIAGDENTAVTLTAASSQYASIPHTIDHRTLPMTLEFWMKSSGTMRLSKYVNGSSNGWFFTSGITGATTFMYGKDASNRVYSTTIGSVSLHDNAWHHVVIAVDTTSARTYIDGKLDTTTAWTGTAQQSTQTVATTLGAYSQTSSPAYASGSLDEVAIYTYALDAQQVKNHYLAGQRTNVTLSASIVRRLSVAATLKGYLSSRFRSVSLRGFVSEPDGEFRGAFTTAERDAFGYVNENDTILNLDDNTTQVYQDAAWRETLASSVQDRYQIAGPDMEVNSITAGSGIIGSLEVDVLTGGTLNADIVIGGTIQTSATEDVKHVEINGDGIRMKEADGSITTNLPTDIDDVCSFSGDVVARGLTVEQNAEFRATTTVPVDAQVILESDSVALSAPSTAPIVTSDYETLTLDAGDIGSYFSFDETSTHFLLLGRDGSGYDRSIREYTNAGVLSRAVTICDSNFSAFSAPVRMGSYVYVVVLRLSDDKWFIRKLNQADLTFVSDTDVSAKLNGPTGGPALAEDGTNLYIASVPTGGSSWLFHKYSSTPAFVSTVTSDLAASGNGTLDGFYTGSADLGAFRYIMSLSVAGNKTFNSSGTQQTNEAWLIATGARSLAWDGTNFWALKNSTDTLYKYSTWKWTTESAVYHVGHTWYETTGDDETLISPRTMFTHKKRSRMNVTTAAAPVGVDEARVYINRGATEPQASGRFDGRLQSTFTPTNAVLTTFTSGGAQNPATSTLFVTGAASYGLIKSVGSEWQLRGDGTMILPVFSADPGAGIEGQIYFNSTSNKFTGFDGTNWVALH